MRSLSSLRKEADQMAEEIDAVTSASQQPACRCIIVIEEGEPLPSDEACGQCGLPRRDEHFVFEEVDVEAGSKSAIPKQTENSGPSAA